MAAEHLKERGSTFEQYWKRPETFNPEENREELVEANLYDLVHAFALLIKRTQKKRSARNQSGSIFGETKNSRVDRVPGKKSKFQFDRLCETIGNARGDDYFVSCNPGDDPAQPSSYLSRRNLWRHRRLRCCPRRRLITAELCEPCGGVIQILFNIKLRVSVTPW